MDVNGRSISKLCDSKTATKKDSGQRRQTTEIPESPNERRRHLRWPVFWQASLTDSDQTTNCLVLDFSPGGVKVRSDSPLPFGNNVGLSFAGAIGFAGTLAWQRGCLLGIEFREEAGQCASLMKDNLAEQATAC